MYVSVFVTVARGTEMGFGQFLKPRVLAQTFSSPI